MRYYVNFLTFNFYVLKNCSFSEI